ncbi:HTH_Tnp_Tc3_2 domain-containing protein [Trichonephila clavipes]|uniref:HTH_Tnp_Tc3_2 domain-containing protein n=1 Tax=Trichonephila clavipes TaxID=2585209 RepID=A0A8X6RCG8_TRICX|nr:HTH_Tnp_Tc3_2 domain-containing protein [Trichonephila clavipes]
MAGYQNLSEFERGVIAGAREMEHRISELDRHATLLKIAADFIAEHLISVTVRAIQRDIIDMSFRSRRTTHVSLLTARHKALRLAWARQNQHWTVDDWKQVTWSEKSRFQLNRSDGRVRVWRQLDEFL